MSMILGSVGGMRIAMCCMRSSCSRPALRRSEAGGLLLWEVPDNRSVYLPLFGGGGDLDADGASPLAWPAQTTVRQRRRSHSESAADEVQT